MRVMVIGLSREFGVSPPDALELCDQLVRRAAMVHAEGDRLVVMILPVREPECSLRRSIPWLQMPWLLRSPGHQQLWYWLCRIMPSMRNNFTNGTKPLPETTLTFHEWGAVAFTWEQFQLKIILLKLLAHLPGTNELTKLVIVPVYALASNGLGLSIDSVLNTKLDITSLKRLWFSMIQAFYWSDDFIQSCQRDFTVYRATSGDGVLFLCFHGSLQAMKCCEWRRFAYLMPCSTCVLTNIQTTFPYPRG